MWLSIQTANVVDSDKSKVADPDRSSKVADPNRSKTAYLAEASQSKFDPFTNSNKYEKDNKRICGHLLSHMNDALFNLFKVQNLAKKIWDTLESRYRRDDAGRKKYVVGKWLQF